jgi:acylphosphatase
VTEARRVVVTGVVQGVGFRYAMLAQARFHGVTGWVRNRRDGSVEALVAGDGEQLAAILAWCRHGPAGASVDQVMVEIASGEFTAFDLLPTA